MRTAIDRFAMEKKSIMANSHDKRPIPDPTFLTTQQLLREIQMLKELLETRLDGIDTATKLVQSSTDRLPDLVDEKVQHLKALHDERFTSIEIQFKERDVRTEQTSKDSKVAIDAALLAAKEAVREQNVSNALSIAKSETGFTKQIDQIGTLITTTTKAADEKIDDIKSRLASIESQKTTIDRGQDRNSNIIGIVIAGAVATVVIFGGIVSVVAFVLARH